MKNTSLTLLAGCMALAFNAQAAVSQNNPDIMLQGFHWNSAKSGVWYNTLQGNVTEISSAGFNMVWLPPPSQAGSLEGYLPEQYNNLNSNYGTENELRTLLAALKANNIKSIADIVINHRNGYGCVFSSMPIS